MTQTYVVRQGTHNSEAFNPVKLHSSILWACMAVRAYEGEAHAAAEHVCKNVIDWLDEQTAVTSADIQRVSTSFLKTYHPEAAYMYQQHNLIL